VMTNSNTARRLRSLLGDILTRTGFEVVRTGSSSANLGGVGIGSVRVIKRSSPVSIWSPEQSTPTAIEEVVSLLRKGRTVIAGVDPALCRQAWWFDLQHASPFSRAARALLTGDKDRATSILVKFYQRVQPQDAASRLGLDPQQSPLRRFSPFAAPMPWDVLSPAVIEKRRIAMYQEENERDGLGRVAYSALFGPVPVAKIESEVERLGRLLTSIRQEGYHRSDQPDGDINGFLLVSQVRNSAAVRLDAGGNHRAAVLAALGRRVIPVRLTPRQLIIREDSGNWPQVESGTLSQAQALSIFDRIVKGDPVDGW
jgi:hypothetical protein